MSKREATDAPSLSSTDRTESIITKMKNAMRMKCYKRLRMKKYVRPRWNTTRRKTKKWSMMQYTQLTQFSQITWLIHTFIQLKQFTKSKQLKFYSVNILMSIYCKHIFLYILEKLKPIKTISFGIYSINSPSLWWHSACPWNWLSLSSCSVLVLW